MRAKLPTEAVHPTRSTPPKTPKPFTKGYQPNLNRGLANVVLPDGQGRPKGYEGNLRRECRALTPEIIEHLRAKLGVPRDGVIAASLLLAYGWGRPTQQINARVITSAGDLTDEELQAIIEGGAAQEQIGDVIDGESSSDE